MTNIIIVDIDGTIADLSHRLPLVSNGRKDWDTFFELADKDEPIRSIIDVVSDYYHQTPEIDELHFVTGRPETIRRLTEDWLKHVAQMYFYADLHMRPAGDTRPDCVIKEEILDRLLSDRKNVVAVFDDRQSVVDMWKRRGLRVFQVHNPEVQVVADPATKGTLHLLVGPSHAGKTTGYCDHIKPGSVYLSSDALRYYLTGDGNDQSRNAEVFALAHTLIREYIKTGVSVVFDATNILNADRRKVVECAAGADVVYHVFDRPVKDKLASLRPGFPESVVLKHDQTFRSNLKDILAGDGFPNVKVEDHR